MPTPQGRFIDHSGTVTSGGTAQPVCPFNFNRRYFLFENLSSGDLWIAFGATAIASQPSILIPTKSGFVMELGFVETEAVSVIGATTGQAFTCKEA